MFKLKRVPPQNGILLFLFILFGLVSRQTSCFGYFLDLPSRMFYYIFLYNNEGEIRVKSCLPDDYTEVLHICTENDRMCHGTLNITVIPFVSILLIKFYDPIYISQYGSFLSLFYHMM